jgi:excinuclease UvrABC ATPase subunit
LTVVTGVSGSGKSSLAFDTAAEGGAATWKPFLTPKVSIARDRPGRPIEDSPAIAIIDQTNLSALCPRLVR